MRRELFRTFIKLAFRIFGERLWLIFVARCLISSRLGFPFFITYLKNRDKICNSSSLYSHLSASAYVSMWNSRQNSVRKRDQSGSKHPNDFSTIHYSRRQYWRLERSVIGKAIGIIPIHNASSINMYTFQRQ